MAESLKRKGESASSHGGKKVPPWMTGLKDSMKDPELQVYKDDTIVIIKDKYPKARHHFLVLPKKDISNLKQLTKEDIPLMRHMEEKGREVAEKASSVLEFRYGYHAVPSMSQVHLHVISQDFDSPSLKTKKHWNSFTTEYFIDSEDVIDIINCQGKYQVDSSKFTEMLKRPLKCHKCSEAPSTIPALKKHLLRHIPK